MKVLKKAIFITFICIFLSTNLMINPLLGVPTAEAAVLPTDLSVDVSNDSSGIAGKNKTVTVTMSNNNSGPASDPDNWIYNVNIALTLGNGLDMISTGYTSLGTNTGSGEHKQIVNWFDLRDLAPGEIYKFTFDVKLREDYRDLTGGAGDEIAFGATLGGNIVVTGSTDPQDYNTPGYSQSKSFGFSISPFEIELLGNGNLLKGAGTAITTSDDMYSRNVSVKIINNPNYDLHMDLSNMVANGVQVNGISAVKTASSELLYSAEGNKSSWNWNDIVIEAGGNLTLNYNAAIFDTFTAANGTVNSSSEQIIPDGFNMPISLHYVGVIPDYDQVQQYIGDRNITLTAKDITIDKAIAHSADIAYGDKFTYTLVARVNQYHNMDNVVITDTIGDGQTFLPATYPVISPIRGYDIVGDGLMPADFDFDVTDLGLGETELEWSIIDPAIMHTGASVTYEYQVSVDDKWYDNKPIVAGDSFKNTVIIGADNVTTRLAASDDSRADATIEHPSIRKEIVEVNGSSSFATQGSDAITSIGDNVRFRITYDASNVLVEQKNVDIIDILPQGTTLVGAPPTISYTDNNAAIDIWDTRTAFTYDKLNNPNQLRWSFGTIPPGTVLSAEYEITINNAPENTNGKQTYNLAKISLENTEGEVISDRSEVGLIYAEPILTISKTADVTTDLTGGEEVTFTITVENTGLATAYNTLVRDTLPAQLVTPKLANNTPITMSGQKIELPVISSIAPGPENKSTMVYKANVLNGVGNAREFVNHAQIEKYYDKSTVELSFRVYDLAYLGTLPKSSVTLTSASPTISKSVNSPADPDNVRIGDHIIYDIAPVIPAGTAAYNGYMLENIPANQMVVAVYKDVSNKAGTAVAYSTTSENDIRFDTDVTLSAGTHHYYVETKVTAVASGLGETQTNEVKFFWKDLLTTGEDHSIEPVTAAVTVKKPQLFTKLTSDDSTLVLNQTTEFQLVIENIGENTAYKFVPTVELPVGFTPSNLPGTASYDAGTHTITFDEVEALSHQAASDIHTLTFDVKLTELKSAGTQFQFIGNSGAYHTTMDMGYPLTSSQGQANINIPSVSVTQSITNHTNSFGTNSFIRAGDKVDYEIVVTVPEGTIAYDLIAEDTLPADFSHESGGVVSGSKVNIAVGDVDASAGVQVKTYTIKALAKTSVSYGATKAESNAVRALWNTTNDTISSQLSVSAIDISISVREPILTIGTITRSATVFNNSTASITVTIPISNSRDTTAYDSEFNIDIPNEFMVESAVMDGHNGVAGVVGASTHKMGWTGVDIAKETKNIVVVLKLREDGAAGAGKTGLIIQANLTSIASRDSTEGGARKVSTLTTNKSTTIDIASATVAKTVTATTAPGSLAYGYVRPGDVITYSITFTVPTHTTAYNAELRDVLGPEQEIADVTIDGHSQTSYVDSYDPDDADYVLSLGDLAGGPHTIIVTSLVSTDGGYTSAEYTYNNVVHVGWEDVNGDFIKSVTDTASGTVKQPSLTPVATANPTSLNTTNETSTIHITIENTSDASAYDLVVEIPIPSDFDIEEDSISHNGVLSSGKISWSITELAGLATLDLTFIIEQNIDTLANSDIVLTAMLVSYSNVDNSADFKQYANVTDDVTIVVNGQHTWTAANPVGVSLLAGETAEFEHIITNTGAGEDTYRITGSTGYPSILKLAGTEVARDSNGDGVWEFLVADNWVTGNYEITLARGATKTYTLEVTAPLTSPKGEVKAKTITTTSITESLQTNTRTDTVTVIGQDYDGVTFDGITIPNNRDNWQTGWGQTIIGAGSVIELAALTSVDITSVTAQIKQVDGGYIGDTNVTPINLTSLGSGKWSTNYTLPTSLTNSVYYVEYKSYNESATTLLQDQETELLPKKANNTFRIAEPELGIALTPSATVVEAVYGYVYTLTINNNLGNSVAYQFTPYIEVPEGMEPYELAEYGHAFKSYDASSRKLYFYSDEEDAAFDLAVNESLSFSFKLQTNADLSADEQFNINAGTGAYYTAINGDARAEKRAAATMTTGTVLLTKTIESTTNIGDNYIRPGDQIVYKIYIDIPDGIDQVTTVHLAEEVSSNLTIEKVSIDGVDTGVNSSTWSKNFVVLSEDLTVYIYAVANSDIATNTFSTEAETLLTWKSKYLQINDLPYSGSADETISTDGKRPLVNTTSFESVNGKTTFESPDDVIEYEGSIVNDGESKAYDTTVIATFPAGLQPVVNTYGNGVYESDAHTITWVVDVDPDESLNYSFDLIARTDVPASTGGHVTFEVGSYNSTSHENYTTQYTGDSLDLAFGLTGGHAINGPFTEDAKAGETATFTHILQNLGAGSDCYNITITMPFSYVLRAGNEVITIEGDGVYQVCLDAGKQIELEVHVSVPVSTPKSDPLTPHTITLSIEGELSGTTISVQDELNIIGEVLDGWVSNQLWSQWGYNTYRDITHLNRWKENTYNPESVAKFSAITSSDATKVKAYIHELDLGGVPSITIDELELTLYNPTTYLTDGYKLWNNVGYTLPDDIVNGRYFAEFRVTEPSSNSEVDATATNVWADAGFNNYLTVKSNIDLVGTVTERRNPSNHIIGAVVTLRDVNRNVIGTETTDGSGSYRFDNIVIKNYILEVEHDHFSEYSRTINTIPAQATDSEVRRDVALIDFLITLEANPSTIVGDGEDTTVLTVTLMNKDGVPVPGVTVTMTAEVGKFIVNNAPVPAETSLVTDSEGKAYITYRSDKIDGLVSQEIPVTATVSDPVRDLFAEDVIQVIFAPGAIKGKVVDSNTGLPINGAKVFVYSDFNNDNTIDFTATQTTGTDGLYKIAIPRGEIPYTVEITKPVLINNIWVDKIFKQESYPDVVNFSDYVEYPSVNTATGLVMQRNNDRSQGFYDQNVYTEMRIEEIRWNAGLGKYEVVPSTDPTRLVGTIDPATGVYTIRNLPYDSSNVAANSLHFRIVRDVPVTTGGPLTEEIVMGTLNVVVGSNGDIIIGESLVDPYGIITDSVTNDIIVGAEVKLYFADTVRNRNKGITPHTLVPLPLLEVPPFPPANNANPHVSDATGNYAWMVFPESDYYILAVKSGYYNYDSMNDVGAISVEFDIVRHDFQMTPISTAVVPGTGSGSAPADAQTPAPKAPLKQPNTNIDLAIDISADKRGYMENSVINLTLDYMNRSAKVANDVDITVDIPMNTTVIDLNGGTLSKSGTQVSWKLAQLTGGKLGQLKIKLKAGSIASGEQELSTTATITSMDELTNLNDDVSRLKLMLFSNNYGVFSHNRYIVGYPDGEFKLNRNISRAEIANIFARILQLRGYVKHQTQYNDVPQGKWYTDGIEAVTNRGLFTGYKDGSFKPDQPITRAELTAVIFKFLQLTERPPVKVNFADIQGHWAANIIEDVHRNRIAEGYTDGSFKPNNHLVRSEAVVMINRLLYRGPLKGADQSYSDVPDSHWASGDVEESTRSHETTRNPDSSEVFIREIESTLGF